MGSPAVALAWQFWARHRRGLCGLLAYLWAKTTPATLIIYGLWPLGILAWVGSRASLPARWVLRTGSQLASGAALAAVPLVVYHSWHGSVSHWLSDTLFRAEGLTRLDFFREISFPWLFRSVCSTWPTWQNVHCLVTLK